MKTSDSAQHGLLQGHWHSDQVFKVLDIWQHKEIGSVKGNVTAKVESHGVAFYCLIPQ